MKIVFLIASILGILGRFSEDYEQSIGKKAEKISKGFNACAIIMNLCSRIVYLIGYIMYAHNANLIGATRNMIVMIFVAFINALIIILKCFGFQRSRHKNK